METQTTLVVPTEDGFDMFPATQFVHNVQMAASAALNLPANKYKIYILLYYLKLFISA